MMIAVGTTAVLMILWTIMIRRLTSTERVLIIGTSPLARQLVDEFAARGGREQLVGIVDDLEASEALTAARVAGPLARLGPIVADLQPDRIVVALSDRRGRLPMRALLEARVRGIVVEDGVEC